MTFEANRRAVGKLVILKFDGNLQQGFRVLLEIGDEGDRPSIELAGALPPSPELASYLLQWRSHYRSLRVSSRIQPQQIIYGGSVNRLEECWHAATELHQQMTQWLESPSFRRLDLRLRESLSLTEPIRVLIRTQDPLLNRLPWHLWDFIERYAKTEIALSAPISERVEVEPTAARTHSVKILAILGSSEDIDVQVDRQFLAALPSAQTTFLVEPSREQIDQQLWQQPWDILFFAGHSSTEGDRGLIHINPTESLSLEELKYGLRQAISKGLQLAIFNSCDGLGLAQSLASLHLPQMVVMREPVPDRIAQAFLKSLLKAFSSGKSLYLSVREAREQLQRLEDRFPCATWLPVICQNSAKTPPTWQALVTGEASERFSQRSKSEGFSTPRIGGGRRPTTTNASRLLHSATRHCTQHLRRCSHQIRKGWIVLLVGLVVTLGLSSPLALSQMQPLEVGIYDRMIRLRPYEGADDRLLIVEITDGQTWETSLSDGSLNRLLDKLEQYQPRVIGLHLSRDFATIPEQSALSTRLQQDPTLITTCKAENFREDSDGVLRRHLLGMLPLAKMQASRCNSDWPFSLQVAAQYLRQQQVEAQFTEAGSREIMLNYRATPEIAPVVTLQQFLTQQTGSNDLADKIVLVGVTAQDEEDRWLTPTCPFTKMPGVIVQAHLISQLLSAALDNRPLLKTLSRSQQIGWVSTWALVGGLLSFWQWQPNNRPRAIAQLLLSLAGATIFLYGLCFFGLLRGHWLPFISLVVALLSSSALVTAYLLVRPKIAKNH